MKEKKVIDYTIEADKKKCILYIVILILLGFLLMWTQIDDLTRMICKICAGVLKKYEPHMYVGIRSETYPLFGKISYLSAGTVYPGIKISLINTGISLGVIILLAGLPWKGRPLAIYLILCSAIHLINYWCLTYQHHQKVPAPTPFSTLPHVVSSPDCSDLYAPLTVHHRLYLTPPQDLYWKLVLADS